jgi:aldehyde:ferredoxin oxidoreductase
MRKFIDIDLGAQSSTSRELTGHEIAECGRYLIAKILLDKNIAKVDPLAPGNPLIFSVGPFAGTNFSNANRLSVGCKSPLTGGIKEANSGGTFGFAMGQLLIAGIVFHDASEDWVIIRITKDGNIRFDSAAPYLGLGNFECAAKLHAAYGDKTSLAICGPVGEYLGLMAGIAFSDTDNRPSRLAARGGVGAVMGAKKVKAIVIDKDRMPPVNDRKKVMGAIKEYGKKLGESAPVKTFRTTGTAMMADIQNLVGGMPTRNFTSGTQTPADKGPFKMGGDFIRELNSSRGGQTEHACMPGCLIKCSNVYVNQDGREIVSPMEYETICLLGTNCGLEHPDDVAEMNEIANDLGVDTIELGATIAVLMDAGRGEFGDTAFMKLVMAEMKAGSDIGQFYASGTARVGKELNVHRVPVIKKQAISAYDPRLIEVTAISMMVTAQGADHTVGNSALFKCDDKSIDELVAESFRVQINSAVADSMGLCVFGRSVTDENLKLIADAVNDAFDAGITPDVIRKIGVETLRLEAAFNKAAGFDQDDDELPSFFHDEALPPSGRTARLHSREVNAAMRALMMA